MNNQMIPWGYVLIAHTKCAAKSRTQKVDSGAEKKCIVKMMRAKTKRSNNSRIKEQLYTLYSEPLAISDHLNCLSYAVTSSLLANHHHADDVDDDDVIVFALLFPSPFPLFFPTTEPNYFSLSLTQNDYSEDFLFHFANDIISRKRFYTQDWPSTLCHPFHLISFSFSFWFMVSSPPHGT